jgi:hypothetical protein
MYGDRLHVAIESKEVVVKIMDQLKGKGFSIAGEREIIPSLEDVFIAMVREQEDKEQRA